jgi:hypothetical protein
MLMTLFQVEKPETVYTNWKEQWRRYWDRRNLTYTNGILTCLNWRKTTSKHLPFRVMQKINLGWNQNAWTSMG